MYLLVFEFLGTNELLLILVAALILFGPRKLPQLSRTLGKNLAEFKRASEDFKRTWEREVDLEVTDTSPQPDQQLLPPENSIMNTNSTIAANDQTIDTVARGSEDLIPSESESTFSAAPPSITPIDPSEMQSIATPSSDGSTEVASTERTAPTKRDWL